MDIVNRADASTLIVELRKHVAQIEALLLAGLPKEIELSLGEQIAVGAVRQDSIQQRVLDSVDAMVFALDSGMRYLFFNRAHAEIMHIYTGLHITLGEDMRRYLPFTDMHDQLAGYVQRAFMGATVSHMMRMGIGSIQPVSFEFIYYPLRAADATIIGVVVLAIECTEQQREAEALRERSDLYAAMFENNNAMKLLIDPTDGRIIDANPAAVAFYGYGRDELKRMTISQINTLSPEKIKIEMERARSRDQLFFLFPHRLASGEIRQVEIHTGPIALQGTTLLFSVLHDVTERVEMEQQLRNANERLSALVEELRAREWGVQTLNRMNEQLMTCHSWHEAYQVIELHARQLFVGMSGSLAMLSADGMLEVMVSWGEFTGQKAFFSSDECWALRQDSIHQIQSPQHGLVCQHFVHPPLYGSMCLPLMAQGETIGVLHVVAGSEMVLNDGIATLIVAFGEAIKLSLSNLRLRESLRKQAIIDQLTGLFNRRYLDEVLPRELQRVLRQGGALCVAIVDLDYFKSYNDRFGHDCGDMLLRQLGVLLREGVRHSDVVCRYGGEEFVLILPGLALNDARLRLESLRQRVASMKIQFNGQAVGSVTASLGLVEAPRNGHTIEELLRSADQALYRAKELGRDQIVVYDECW